MKRTVRATHTSKLKGVAPLPEVEARAKVHGNFQLYVVKWLVHANSLKRASALAEKSDRMIRSNLRNVLTREARNPDVCKLVFVSIYNLFIFTRKSNVINGQHPVVRDFDRH